MATKKTAKKPLSVNRRSHALNKTNHFQKPNLIKTTIDGKSVITSAREARAAKKASKKAA